MPAKHAAKPRQKANLSPELEQERDAILQLLTNEEDDHWLIGFHYNRIVDGRLYQAAKFKTAYEFAKKQLGKISPATLVRYGAIARSFSEEVAKKYGSTLLASLLTYERLSDSTLPTGDPGQLMIEVPNADGSMASKPFTECTQQDMRAALHKFHPPPAPLPIDDRRKVKALQEAIIDMLGDPPVIVMHAKRGGANTFVTFNLPINYLEFLRDILVSVFRIPGEAIVRIRMKPREAASVSKGRVASAHDRPSISSKLTSAGTKPVGHGATAKARRTLRGNGQPRRS